MAYLTTIPIANNKLAVSQPQIQTNFDRANTVMGINHYPFADNTGNAGKHNIVTLPVKGSIPAGILSGEGVLYTKTVSVSSINQSQLYYHQDLTINGNEYQLTRADETNAGTFSNLTNYTPYPGGSPAANQNGGWTFLPGGLLFQYGVMKSVGDDTQVFYPIKFNQLFSITASRQQAAGGSTSWGVNSVGTSSFRFTSSSSSSGTTFYWQAIGN